LNRDFRKSL